jgi:hypothetical protein
MAVFAQLNTREKEMDGLGNSLQVEEKKCHGQAPNLRFGMFHDDGGE